MWLWPADTLAAHKQSRYIRRTVRPRAHHVCESWINKWQRKRNKWQTKESQLNIVHYGPPHCALAAIQAVSEAVTQACKILMWTLSGCQLHSSISFAFFFVRSVFPSFCCRYPLCCYFRTLRACTHQPPATSRRTDNIHTAEQINHIFFAQQHDNLFYARVICGRTLYQSVAWGVCARCIHIRFWPQQPSACSSALTRYYPN